MQSSSSQTDRFDLDHGASMSGALDAANETIGRLRVVEYSMRAAASEDRPLGDAERQEVLVAAAGILHQCIDTLEAALDFIDDYPLEENGGPVS